MSISSFMSDMKAYRGSWFVDYLPNRDPLCCSRSYRYFDLKILDEDEMDREAKIKELARADYEKHRKLVAGRPAWEKLNLNDLYDKGMYDLAIARGTAECDRLYPLLEIP